MKKVIHYCVIIFFILIFVPGQKVYADGEYCDVGNSSSVNYKISYDITKFIMDEQKIHFEGWSFLDHMDNYGGINKTTYVAAYVGDWNSSWNKLENCKNSSSCYYTKAQIDNWDMYDSYFTRCVGNACSDSIRNNILDKLIKNKKVFEDASCTGHGDYGGSHCTYHNIGFKFNMNISDIVEKLGNNKTIKFRLITKVRFGKIRKNLRKDNNNIKTDSIDIGVFPNTSCTIFSKKCSTGKGTYQSKDSKKTVVLNGLSQNALFTAVEAQGAKDGEYKSLRDKCFYPGGTYKIIEVSAIKTDWSNWKGNKTGTFTGRLAQIKLIGKNQPQGEDQGFSWTAWFKAATSLKLTLVVDPPDVPPSCPTADYCVGSGCKYDKNNCPIPPKNLKSVTCPSLEKDGCNDASYNSTCDGKVSNSKYYLRIPDSEFTKKFAGYTFSSSEKQIQHVGGYYYFPINVLANVSYSQTANLTINGFSNNQTVVSGLNFAYSYQYTVNSKWNYIGEYKDNGETTENHTFGVYSTKIKKTGEVKTKTAKIIVFPNKGDLLYVKNGSSFKAVNRPYSVQVLKDIIAESVKLNVKSIDATNNTVTFDDSNDASKKQNTSDAGTFSCSSPISTDNWGAGVSRNSTCFYKIKKAFFSNQMNGNIIYRDLDSIAGYYVDPNNKDGVNSWYYIPANLKTGDTFEFTVENTNLSLIKGVDFTYKAICSVKGKNEIHDSSKIKYRSIDTSNPFPKATKISDYPKNWQQYVKDKGLNRIISNSFSGISYQTNFFKNKTYIDSLKSTYGDYYSYNDMDTSGNGTSAIIHKENLFSKINGNHNRAGEYKEENDKVQS